MEVWKAVERTKELWYRNATFARINRSQKQQWIAGLRLCPIDPRQRVGGTEGMNPIPLPLGVASRYHCKVERDSSCLGHSLSSLPSSIMLVHQLNIKGDKACEVLGCSSSNRKSPDREKVLHRVRDRVAIACKALLLGKCE